MALTPDQQRRLAAKRVNEATKLSATGLNGLAVGGMIGGLVTPALSGREMDAGWLLAIGGAAFALHNGARYLLSFLVSEE